MDLALVELSREVSAPKARPIRLITRAQVAVGLEQSGMTALVSGFGMTGGSPLQRPAQQLHGVETLIGNNDPKQPNFIRIHKPGTGICKGDSGGPLCVKDENGQWILVGAASYSLAALCQSDAEYPVAVLEGRRDFVRGFRVRTLAGLHLLVPGLERVRLEIGSGGLRGDIHAHLGLFEKTTVQRFRTR
jgi:hypothetical protein